jgi:dUTP pyrophosphatase
MKLKIKLDSYAKEPVRAHEDDAGLDLRSTETRWVHPGRHEAFDTGVHVAIPSGYVGMIASKSGLMLKGLTARGIIDSGFRGSIGIVLYNHGNEGYLVKEGDKIAQLIIVPIEIPELEYVDELDETERGDGGFGSSGR